MSDDFVTSYAIAEEIYDALPMLTDIAACELAIMLLDSMDRFPSNAQIEEILRAIGRLR